MALFLSPIPETVLNELEKRTLALGDSSGGTRVDLSSGISGTTEWKYSRTPWVRAASFAVLRDSINPGFKSHWVNVGGSIDDAKKTWQGNGEQPVYPHPLKNHHRLKNVLYGGGLKDLSNQSLDPSTYTNILDDHATYNRGFEGHLSAKLQGYKTNMGGDDPNSRSGVPNPGILGVTVENVGQLGSLKKIDLEVECHDFAQLQMIESLYMAPGITCLLEWGWSVDTSGANVQQNLVDLGDGGSLSNVTRLHQELLAKSKALNYSYEGAIATVTNYTWSAKDNGSFSCNISMRSRGEAMLGTQIKSAHAPLFHSISKITTRYNALKYNVEPEDRKKTLDSKAGRAYDSNGNVAQLHLESKMGTLPNQYYPSFHAAALSVGLNGKVAGEVDDLSILGAETETMPAFPRWYYKYKMTQAAAERNRIADAAKNSVANGNKNADVQKKLAKQIAQDTIANYVNEIIAPAISKHSAGTGKMEESTAVPPNIDINDPHGGTLEDNYGGMKCAQNTVNIGSITYGQMTGQPWDRGSKIRPTDGRFGEWYFFKSWEDRPWKYRGPSGGLSQNTLNQHYGFEQKLYKSQGGTSAYEYGASTGTAAIKCFYRDTIQRGGKKYGLLTGAYLPWGSGGDWKQHWQDAVNNPLRTHTDNPASGNNLIKAFFEYYTALHTRHGHAAYAGSGLFMHDIWPTLDGAASLMNVSHPALHIAAKCMIGYYSWGKGKSLGANQITADAIGIDGNQFPGAQGPLSVLSQAMQSACIYKGEANTLGMMDFDDDIINYITEHFGSVPTAKDVGGFIAGKNPVTKKNYFEKPTEQSAAQSCWTEMDTLVGAGGSSAGASYGLPNKFTRGQVGRYLGTIHVQHPSIYIHGRLKTGVNFSSMASGHWKKFKSSPNKFGIYRQGSASERGYGTTGQDFADEAAALRGDGEPNVHQIRTMSGGNTSSFKYMDYPMPLWGHYSALDSRGNFRFVKSIKDAKSNFMNEVREKKKNAALAKKLAFADAYAQYEEYRKITDGDVFIPFSVLEQIINDNIAIESKSGHKLTKFDSGDHRLAGQPKETPEDCTDQGRLINTDDFVKLVNDYNDGGFNINVASFEDTVPTTPTTGIQPIDIDSRMRDYTGEEAKTIADGDEPAAIESDLFSHHFGFPDSCNNLTTYFYAAASPADGFTLPGEMYQTVSLPSKICNHKYLASTDPRICVLPGQTGIVAKRNDQAFATEIYGEDASNKALPNLQGYKSFTDDSDRKYGYLSHILINTEFIYDCFDNATTIKDALQKVLEGISSACGNIWNFKFMIDGGVDSGTTRIVDANYSNLMCDLVAEFPVMRTNSIVRNYSLESKIPNAMAVQALYGNNTAFGDGSVPNSLYELGNMFIDIAHENVTVPIVSTETEDSDDIFVIPKSPTKRVQALGHTLSFHIHDNLSDEHVSNADRILKTILNDRNNASAGDNALLDHNVIPLKMSFEIDGISGIHFGHALTATHLPERYKDTVCFQVTNVKHDVKTTGWTTTVEAIMRRRPIDMGVYTLGKGGGAFNKNEMNFTELKKDQLRFTRDPISWYHEEGGYQNDLINAENPSTTYILDTDGEIEAKNNQPQGK